MEGMTEMGDGNGEMVDRSWQPLTYSFVPDPRVGVIYISDAPTICPRRQPVLTLRELGRW
jgi:hypothetical protein